jgi:hypothetical protein
VHRRLLTATFTTVLIAAALGWTTVAAAAPPGEGAGGPVLVITAPGDQFGRYYAEILTAEGLNAFERRDIGQVTEASLGAYSVVVLAQVDLNAAQASMLTNWVNGGGNLIAMRPDAFLAPLLGLGSDTGDLANGYMKVDPASGPGAGITSETMQFHDTADQWTLAGASRVADLYSSANTATPNPAVTIRSVGSAGGQAAAFTYDLARSVVYTRQGNPAWAGDERDGALFDDGTLGPIRSDDMFFGAKVGDVQPDWVDLSKVAIPQADEQQRLFANLITQMSADRVPMPRFWYFPRGEEAVVVMTGDDHQLDGTTTHFERFKALSPPGCSVADWDCVRSTSYMYDRSEMLNPTVAAYQNEGFEIALHLFTGCQNYSSPQVLREEWDLQLPALQAKWPSMAPPTTNRTHCIPWSDWASQATVEREYGIRLDTNYYYWPASWVQDRPGMFTGSGIPMRFANDDGSLIDVYQATTQLPDESGLTMPTHIATLLDNAIGAKKYFGAFTANIHTDSSVEPAEQIVAAAQARGVPVISARQLLTWIDGRNNAEFGGISFSGGSLRFNLNPPAGARGLETMVPVSGPGGAIVSLTRNGAPVSASTRVVKGIQYLVFPATAGAYVATYPGGGGGGGGGGTTPPPAGGTTPPPGGTTNPPKPKPPTSKPSGDKTAPRVKVTLRKVRASRRGMVSLRVSCPRGESKCVVDLRLKRGRSTVGRKKLSIAGGKGRSIAVKLSSRWRGRLADAGALRLVASAAARDAAGNRATTSKRMRILAP